MPKYSCLQNMENYDFKWQRHSKDTYVNVCEEVKRLHSAIHVETISIERKT